MNTAEVCLVDDDASVLRSMQYLLAFGWNKGARFQQAARVSGPRRC